MNYKTYLFYRLCGLPGLGGQMPGAAADALQPFCTGAAADALQPLCTGAAADVLQPLCTGGAAHSQNKASPHPGRAAERR